MSVILSRVTFRLKVLCGILWASCNLLFTTSVVPVTDRNEFNIKASILEKASRFLFFGLSLIENLPVGWYSIEHNMKNAV